MPAGRSSDHQGGSRAQGSCEAMGEIWEPTLLPMVCTLVSVSVSGNGPTGCLGRDGLSGLAGHTMGITVF